MVNCLILVCHVRREMERLSKYARNYPFVIHVCLVLPKFSSTIKFKTGGSSSTHIMKSLSILKKYHQTQTGQEQQDGMKVFQLLIF